MSDANIAFRSLHYSCDTQKPQSSGDPVAQVHSTRWRWKNAFGGLAPPCSQVPEITDLSGFLRPSSVLPALPLARVSCPLLSWTTAHSQPSWPQCILPHASCPQPMNHPPHCLQARSFSFLELPISHTRCPACLLGPLVTGPHQSPLLHIPSQARKVLTKHTPTHPRVQTHPSLAFLRQ